MVNKGTLKTIGVIGLFLLAFGMCFYWIALIAYDKQVERYNRRVEVEDLGIVIHTNVVIESSSMIYEIGWDEFLSKLEELNSTDVYYYVDQTGSGTMSTHHPRFYVFDSTLQEAWRTDI